MKFPKQPNSDEWYLEWRFGGVDAFNVAKDILLVAAIEDSDDPDEHVIMATLTPNSQAWEFTSAVTTAVGKLHALNFTQQVHGTALEDPSQGGDCAEEGCTNPAEDQDYLCRVHRLTKQ